MLRFKLYSQVCIVRILGADSDYDGWKLNKRAPIIGDIGCLIDIIDVAKLPTKYIVEMTEPETGVPIWLADFFEEELEVVE